MKNRKHMDEMPYFEITSPGRLQKSLTTLEGILKGIAIDKQINSTEIEALLSWIAEHENVKDFHPYDEISTTLENSIEDGIITREEKEGLFWLIENLRPEGKYFTVLHREIQVLHGIILGILSDGIVTEKEIYGLKSWIKEHEFLKGTYPYDEIESVLISILADKIIDEGEKALLKNLFEEFIGLVPSDTSINIDNESLSITGVCAMCPEVVFKDMHFCLTGFFQKKKRKEIVEIIENLGGLYHYGVVKKLDYLIIGADSNPCWAFSCYGRKVEQAVQYRKSGEKIIITHEFDFWDAVQDLGGIV